MKTKKTKKKSRDTRRSDAIQILETQTDDAIRTALDHLRLWKTSVGHSLYLAQKHLRIAQDYIAAIQRLSTSDWEI
jgi:hypothetical protein